MESRVKKNVCGNKAVSAVLAFFIFVGVCAFICCISVIYILDVLFLLQERASGSSDGGKMA